MCIYIYVEHPLVVWTNGGLKPIIKSILADAVGLWRPEDDMG